MKSLFLIVVLAAFHIGTGDVPPKLVVTVYYESKCPDSRKFIIEQLVPAVNLFQDRLIVRLVPFGKARSISSGFTQFECQHGPPECLGNMVQACALQRLRSRPDVDAVAYVACEMRTLASTAGSLKCVKHAQISPSSVHQCLTSVEGTELQLEAEKQTNVFKPKFIPTITVNGVFDQEIQDNAISDLTGTLCSILNDVKLCASHFSNHALHYILL